VSRGRALAKIEMLASMAKCRVLKSIATNSGRDVDVKDGRVR